MHALHSPISLPRPRSLRQLLRWPPLRLPRPRRAPAPYITPANAELLTWYLICLALTIFIYILLPYSFAHGACHINSHLCGTKLDYYLPGQEYDARHPFEAGAGWRRTDDKGDATQEGQTVRLTKEAILREWEPLREVLGEEEWKRKFDEMLLGVLRGVNEG